MLGSWMIVVKDQAMHLAWEKSLESGVLQFKEVMTNARTYTDNLLDGPADSLSPLPS